MALSTKQKLAGAGRWLLQILLGVAFLTIGFGKFGDPSWARSFERWGYPQGFHILTGVIEMAGGLLLLVPRFSSYGALALGGVMLAAAATHASAGQPWTRPLPHLTLLMILATARWRFRWRPNGASPVPGATPAQR